MRFNSKKITNPEDSFSCIPNISQRSSIQDIQEIENRAGVVFANRNEFEHGFNIFQHGEVALFDSTGMEGNEKSTFYRNSWSQALKQLETKGYFKKPQDTEGLSSHIFDTQVEGLKLEEAYVLKVFYSSEDDIEKELSVKTGSHLAITSAALDIKWNPTEDWWFKIDIGAILSGIGYSEKLIHKVLQSLTRKNTLKKRVPLKFHFQGRDLILNLSFFLNRHIRRRADQYLAIQGQSIAGGAWDNKDGSITSDSPSLLISITLTEKDPKKDPLENYKSTHIYKKTDVDIVLAAKNHIKHLLENIDF